MEIETRNAKRLGSSSRSGVYAYQIVQIMTQKVSILTFLGHLVWTWLTWNEYKFWNWLSKVKKYMFRTGSMRRTRLFHFHFRFFIPKTILMINHLREKRFFHLIPCGAKTIDLTSTSIEKRHRGMKRAPKYCSRILPSYRILRDNSDCLQKIAIFSKFDLRWPLVVAILTWTEKDFCKSLRSRRGLSYTFYCCLLSIAVFEIRGVSEPLPATNWTF